MSLRPVQPVIGEHRRGTFNFNSFNMAFATTFLIVTGDEWNTIMYQAVSHAGKASIFWFVAVIIIIRYTILSMLVAVLFDQVERDSILVVQESARTNMMSVVSHTTHPRSPCWGRRTSWRLLTTVRAPVHQAAAGAPLPNRAPTPKP